MSCRSNTGYRKALHLFTSGEYEGVLEACDDEILREGDKLAEALLMRATFFLLKGQATEARPDLDKLIYMEDGNKKVGLMCTLLFFLN